MGRIARLRRPDHRPASNNNSFFVYNCVSGARRAPRRSRAIRPIRAFSVQSVFQRARKPTMRGTAAVPGARPATSLRGPTA